MIYKLVSTTESQVGKYIDINGDGIPEGIIFADLAVGGEGCFGYDQGTYKIPTLKKEKKDYIKDYVIKGKFSHKLNGEQEMLTPILDGFERFYIMALEDVDEDTFYFYNMSSKEKFEYQTEDIKFGTGKKNTTRLMNSWNGEKYGPKHPRDIWGCAKKDIQNGWFIPSIDEWCAFAEQLKVTDENFQEKGFMGFYWASSVTTTYNLVIPSEKLADKIDFEHNTTGMSSFDYIYPVRLAITY